MNTKGGLNLSNHILKLCCLCTIQCSTFFVSVQYMSFSSIAIFQVQFSLVSCFHVITRMKTFICISWFSLQLKAKIAKAQSEKTKDSDDEEVLEEEDSRAETPTPTPCSSSTATATQPKRKREKGAI